MPGIARTRHAPLVQAHTVPSARPCFAWLEHIMDALAGWDMQYVPVLRGQAMREAHPASCESLPMNHGGLTMSQTDWVIFGSNGISIRSTDPDYAICI